jgi:hypothetical protein
MANEHAQKQESGIAGHQGPHQRPVSPVKAAQATSSLDPEHDGRKPITKIVMCLPQSPSAYNDELWAATDTVCRNEAAKQDKPLAISAHYEHAKAHAKTFLLKHRLKSETIEIVAAQLAIQLTVAHLGELEAASIVDDYGALDVLRLRHDATADEIGARYRLLARQLAQPGGEVLLRRSQEAFCQLQAVGRV